MSVIIIEFPYWKINTGVSIINVKITKKVAVDHGQNKLTALRWIWYHAVRVMLGIHTDFWLAVDFYLGLTFALFENFW